MPDGRRDLDPAPRRRLLSPYFSLSFFLARFFPFYLWEKGSGDEGTQSTRGGEANSSPERQTLMPRYFLGVDIGSSKSHACIADESGTVVGFGSAGAGNHETVGFDGMIRALRESTHNALAGTGVTLPQIAGAGFGIAGFDWHTERTAMLKTIATLGLDAPVDAVNDAMLGVIAGSAEGWGIAIVSGTGCNCRGRTRDRKREGKVR